MTKTYTEIIFDLETKSFFDDTGSFDPSILGVSLVSLYKRNLDENLKEIDGQMMSFWESDFPNMWQHFQQANRIIGFNSKRFDVPALKNYAPPFFAKLPHYDLLEILRNTYGHGSSLDRIAKDTLNRGKIDVGSNAIVYWNKGDKESLAKLKKYCEEDVAITRDVYDFGLKNKHIKFTDRWNTPRVVDIDFSYPPEDPISQESLF
ncbi:ribonuclease H-like domain-containing protein [Candidatus Microgenomates bacterium]|nr:ribonuclease H-like domain-containing protein [Candidatus Microgenomates bacterium]